MMKTLSIVGLLFVFIFGGLMFYTRTRGLDTVEESTAANEPARSPIIQAQAKVTVLSGALEIELPSGQSKTVAGQTRVSPGTTIKTSEGSRALIELSDGSIARLEGRSTLRLKSLGGNEVPFVALELLSGRLFGQTRQPLEVSAPWHTLLTPNTRIDMGNNALDIVRLAGKTKIINFKDNVAVTAQSTDTTGIVTAHATLTLHFLESTAIDDSALQGPFSIIPITPETIQLDPWLMYNIEEELKRGATLPPIVGIQLSIPTPTPTPAPQALNTGTAATTSEKIVLP